VEAEVRATGGGLVPSGSATPEAATGGGRPIRLGYSIGSDRRGVVSLGSCAPLATPPPSRRSEDAIAIDEGPN
jgi:hypothetical protein